MQFIIEERTVFIYITATFLYFMLVYTFSSLEKQKFIVLVFKLSGRNILSSHFLREPGLKPQHLFCLYLYMYFISLYLKINRSNQ